MVLDDPEHDRQPQPRTLANGLGGEEGFENMCPGVRVHAAAGIADPDRDLILLVACLDADDTGSVDGLRRVVDQVEEDLIELRRRAVNRGELAEIALDLDPALELVLADLERRLQALVQIEQFGRRAVHPAEVLQTLHQLVDLVHAVHGVLKQHIGLDHAFLRIVAEPAGGLHDRQRFLDRLDIAQRIAQRRVDLVRYAGNHLAQRRHLLGLDQLSLVLV